MAKTKFEVYKDNKGNYRWRLLAQNGEPVASSGEGFKEKRTAMNAVKKLKEWANTETIMDLEKLKDDALKQKEKDAKAKAVAKSTPSKKSASSTKAAPKKTVTKKAAPKPTAKKTVAKPAAAANKAAPKPAIAKDVVKEVIISKTVI